MNRDVRLELVNDRAELEEAFNDYPLVLEDNVYAMYIAEAFVGYYNEGALIASGKLEIKPAEESPAHDDRPVIINTIEIDGMIMENILEENDKHSSKSPVFMEVPFKTVSKVIVVPDVVVAIEKMVGFRVISADIAGKTTSVGDEHEIGDSKYAVIGFHVVDHQIAVVMEPIEQKHWITLDELDSIIETNDSGQIDVEKLITTLNLIISPPTSLEN